MESLESLRIKAQLTHKAAADHFKVSESTWKRWEASGKNIPMIIYIALQDLVYKKMIKNK